MSNDNTIIFLDSIIEKLTRLFGMLDVKILNLPSVTEKKTTPGFRKDEGENKIEVSKNFMLDAMKGSANYAQDILKLFGQSESTVGRILNYFMQFLGLINQGISIGNVISSLISFIPGGGIISGALSGGGALSTGVNNIMKPEFSFQPDITVLVQSEIEKSKAVKFLRNYNPAANARSNLSNL